MVADVSTRIDRLRKLNSRLKTERTRMETYWQDVADFIHPDRYRKNRSDRTAKNLRLSGTKVIKDTAGVSARTLQAGMMGGITPQTRDWFRLSFSDANLNEVGSVKEWLYEVTRRMNNVFHKSNLYQMLPVVYGDAGSFGTGAMILQEDDSDVIRVYDVPPGSYVISGDDRGMVNTFIREMSMTVGQIVKRFGLSNASDRVKNLYEHGDVEEWVDITHAIIENPDWNPNMLGSRYKKYLSLYFEESSKEKILGDSGYDEFPVLCFRWNKTGEDVWGTNCPGLSAMGSIKSLQHTKKRGAQVIDKKVDPPLVGTGQLRGSMQNSRMPGGITWMDTTEGRQGLTPLYQVNFDMREMIEWGREDESHIRDVYFVDLFLLFASDNKTGRTATEIMQKQEEKMVILGPTLERVNDDLLDKIIDRVFNIMFRRNLIPDPPTEISGMPLRVEYISIAAQAQKMIGLGALQETAAFVGSIAQFKADVLDKFDTDQAIDEYADIRGVSPRVIRSDDQVSAIRQQRAEAQAAQAQQEQAMQAAQGAKLLSDADMSGDNALTRAVGSMQ